MTPIGDDQDLAIVEAVDVLHPVGQPAQEAFHAARRKIAPSAAQPPSARTLAPQAGLLQRTLRVERHAVHGIDRRTSMSSAGASAPFGLAIRLLSAHPDRPVIFVAELLPRTSARTPSLLTYSKSRCIDEVANHAKNLPRWSRFTNRDWRHPGSSARYRRR